MSALTHPETGRALAGTGTIDAPIHPTRVVITQPVAKVPTGKPNYDSVIVKVSPVAVAIDEHATIKPIVTGHAPVAAPSNNPQVGMLTKTAPTSLALPQTPLFTNIFYPVIAAILAAIVLIYVVKVK